MTHSDLGDDIGHESDDLNDDSGGILDWLGSVRGTLDDFADNPREFIVSALLLWAINRTIDFVEMVVNLLFTTYSLIAGIPATVGGAFGGAGAVLSGHAFGVFGTITDLGLGLIEGLGWTAPLVGALLFVVLMESAEEIGPPMLSALSNLLGAIPVVGSILDALLTFGLELAANLRGDDS